MSADGTVVGYPSSASNLVDADENGLVDGFLTQIDSLEDPIVFISQGSPRVGETADEMQFRYTVCQRAGRQERFEFGWQTADGAGTATRDEDYVDSGGHLEFEGTVTEVFATAQVLDDDVDEPWETVYVDGNLETGAYVPARERGTIEDDDPDPGNGPVYFEREGEILAVETVSEAEPKAIASGTDPAVSRDGRRLAFIRHTSGEPDQLMIAGADGSNAESVLVANGAGEGFGLGRPAWSPDGTKLAVTDFNGNDTGDIAVVTNFETDEAETVLDDAETIGPTLSYSPDGARLAFDLDGAITTVDVDTGETDALGSGRDPSYGPQGNLVFTRSGGLWILPDGGAADNFEPADGGREASFARPAYSPDGSALVYVVDEAGQYIETALIANGDNTQLTPDGSVDAGPAWGAAGGPPLPTVSIGDATAAEGAPLTFDVDLSAPAATQVTVTATTSAGSAGSSDFTGGSAQVIFDPGETHSSFAVETLTDELDEDSETLSVALSSPSGAVIGDGQATGTITDDDNPPAVSIGDAEAAEGENVEFPLTLSSPSGRAVSVQVTTADDTTTAGDYSPLVGASVTIPAGSTEGVAVVQTTEDRRCPRRTRASPRRIAALGQRPRSTTKRRLGRHRVRRRRGGRRRRRPGACTHGGGSRAERSRSPSSSPPRRRPT